MLHRLRRPTLSAVVLLGLLASPCGRAQPAPTAGHPHFAAETTGAGPHVVLLPGLASGPTTWAPVLTALTDRYTVHLITVAGFAGVPRATGGDSDMLLDALRDELAAYVAGLDGPAVIVGHSLGGFTALRVAVEQPAHLTGIVVVDALPFLAAAVDSAMTPDRARAQIAPSLPFMASQTPDQVRMSQAMALRGLVRDTSAVAALLADNGRSDAGAIAQAFAEMVTTDARPDLPRVAVPALVVVAADGYGGVPPAALYARQYAGLAGVEVEVVPQALHFITYDQPEALLALLAPFLDRALPAPAP